MQEKILSEMTAILIEKYGCNADEVTTESNIFNDLGMDSLDALDFSMDLEKHFNVHMDDDKVNDLESIGKIAGHIEYLLQEAGERYSN